MHAVEPDEGEVAQRAQDVGAVVVVALDVWGCRLSQFETNGLERDAVSG